MSLAISRADKRGLAVGGYHVFINKRMEELHSQNDSRRRFFSAFVVDGFVEVQK
jgi:hypothetical protein